MGEVELKCRCGGRIVPIVDLEFEAIFFKCTKCGKRYTIDDLVDMLVEVLEKKGKKDIVREFIY